MLLFKYFNTPLFLCSFEKLSEKLMTMELDEHSVAGHVGKVGQMLNVADVSQHAFAERCAEVDAYCGYNNKTMLLVPIKTTRGELIGVIQLINKMNLLRRESDTTKKIKRAKILLYPLLESG